MCKIVIELGFKSATYNVAAITTFSNLNVGEDVYVDEVGAGHQIDGGQKDVASEKLLEISFHDSRKRSCMIQRM